MDPFQRVLQRGAYSGGIGMTYDVCLYCEQWENYVSDIKKISLMLKSIDIAKSIG